MYYEIDPSPYFSMVATFLLDDSPPSIWIYWDQSMAASIGMETADEYQFEGFFLTCPYDVTPEVNESYCVQDMFVMHFVNSGEPTDTSCDDGEP